MLKNEARDHVFLSMLMLYLTLGPDAIDVEQIIDSLKNDFHLEAVGGGEYIHELEEWDDEDEG